MALESDTVMHECSNHHTIYLKKVLVEDSAFPFGPDEKLLARIDGRKLVIERMTAKKEARK